MGCGASAQVPATQSTSKEVRYEHIRHKIRPLDVLFFKGSSAYAQLIRAGERLTLGNGDWNHVGIVVTTDVIPIKNGVPGDLYIWESQEADATMPNYETGSPKFNGVMVRDLAVVVPAFFKAYRDAKIGWAKLMNNPYRTGDTKGVAFARNRLGEVHKVCHGLPYNKDVVNLLSPLFDKLALATTPADPNAAPTRLFCSEFASYVYQALDMYPPFDQRRMAPEEMLMPTNPAGVVIFKEPVVFTAP